MSYCHTILALEGYLEQFDSAAVAAAAAAAMAAATAAAAADVDGDETEGDYCCCNELEDSIGIVDQYN